MYEARIRIRIACMRIAYVSLAALCQRMSCAAPKEARIIALGAPRLAAAVPVHWSAGACTPLAELV